MPETTTRTVVFARETFRRDRDRARDVYMDGVTGEEDDYGMVQIVRQTITETRSTGDVARLLDRNTDEDVLCAVDSDGAAHLINTLAHALAASLRVRPGERPNR